MKQSDATPARRPSLRWVIGCLAATAMLSGVAYLEIKRVEEGRLFALPLPWDAPPSEVEILDAPLSVQDLLVPAILFLAIVGTIIAVVGIGRLSAPRPSRTRSVLTVLFLLGVLADLGTTLWFFHDGGIDRELHPGIRLFGYAYGRTVGPIAGKAVQALGVLAIARYSGRLGVVLLTIVTCFYAAAAIYNASQM